MQATSWMTYSFSGDMITIQAVAGTLEDGTYYASLPVRSSGGDDTIAISLVVGSPTLTLTPAAVTFGDTVGGTGPAEPKMVAMENTGGGTFASLGDFGVPTISYLSGAPGWLEASLPGSGFLELRATTGNLEPRGTPYTAHVSVTSTHGGTDGVDVTFTVAEGNEPPELNLSINSISFSGIRGGDPSPAQAVNALNDGGGGNPALGTISVDQAGTEDWLSVTVVESVVTLTPTTTELLPDTPGDLTLEATISIVSEYGGEKSLLVSFDLLAPILSLSSERVTFSAAPGDPETLQTAVIISNAAGSVEALRPLTLGEITFQGGGSGWLTLNHDSGDTILGVSIELSVTAAELSEGTLVALVPVNSVWGGTATVEVHFAVREQDRTFEQPEIQLVKWVGGAVAPLGMEGLVVAPAGDTIKVDSVGVRKEYETYLPLSGLRVGSPSYPQGQPTGWITGAFLSRTDITLPGQIAALFVVVEPGDLATGDYEAFLEVMAEALGEADPPKETFKVVLQVR